MIIVRKASLNDIEEIKKLNLELFKKEFKEFDSTLNCDWTFSKDGDKYFKHKLSRKNFLVLVALDNSKIIGYLIGAINKSSSVRNIGKFGELDNMLILSEYRGKGMGTRLVNEFFDWCKKNRVNRARVTASFKNQEGINFYKKNGFFEWDLVLERDL